MIKGINKISVMTNIPFEINEKRILRELRIPILKSLDELDEKKLGKEIKRIIELAYGLISGKACYRTFRIKKILENKVLLDKSDTLMKGKSLVRILKDCEYCSLFVTTIGHDLENHVSEMAKDDPSGAFFLENIGSWMAEYMAETVNNRIAQEIIKTGFIPKKRYSAGYGDWPVTSQQEILELVEAKRIGVSISESSLMIPQKSVSALIGWGRKE